MILANWEAWIIMGTATLFVSIVIICTYLYGKKVEKDKDKRRETRNEKR